MDSLISLCGVASGVRLPSQNRVAFSSRHLDVPVKVTLVRECRSATLGHLSFGCRYLLKRLALGISLAYGMTTCLHGCGVCLGDGLWQSQMATDVLSRV